MKESLMQSDLFVDRTGWGSGAWDGELDRYEWRSKGMPCLIVRAPVTGALCGYVGLSPDHPFYGLPYDHEDIEVNVHGGLTYADYCQGHICHAARLGEQEVYWLGFDCSHYGDEMPAISARSSGICKFGTYKEIDFVRKEVERLTEQLSIT